MPGSHAHTARPASFRHDECGPHGEDKQGSVAGCGMPKKHID